MDSQLFFNKIKSDLALKFNFLEDKPEETVDSTLKACWLAASGLHVSAEEAMKKSLPELTQKQTTILIRLIEQRLNNVPLAHITGRQSFMGVELLSDSRALIPRKETEILGKEALRIAQETANRKRIIRVMDICCGSGNLGLAVAYHNPQVHIFATDLSKDAVALTRDNINFLNLNQRIIAEPGDLFEAFENKNHFGKTDIVICNPPYISSAKVEKMNTEISGHEPSLAFDGGMFGTKIIQRLITEAPGYLDNEGWLIFEVGLGQGPFVMELCNRTEQYGKIEPVKDEHGNIRVIRAQLHHAV